MNDSNSTVEYRNLDSLGFPGYRIGSDGSVWTRRDRIGLGHGRGTLASLRSRWAKMRPTKTKRSRMQVALSPSRKSIHVHRLVLIAFVGPCPVGMECCHNDGDSTNNRLTNLRWDTKKANAADRDRHGRTPRGEKVGGARLTAGDVKCIRAALAAGGTGVSLARKYRVSTTHISEIRRRTSWAHIH